MESFNALFPKKYVFGQYTFVEPDLNIKFPSFQCCLVHASSSKQIPIQSTLKPPLQTSLKTTLQQPLQTTLKTSLQPPLQTSVQPSSQPSLHSVPQLRPSLKPPLRTSLKTSVQPSLHSSLPELRISLKPPLQTSLKNSVQTSLQTSVESHSQSFVQPALQPKVELLSQPFLPPSQPLQTTNSLLDEHEDMDEFVLNDHGNKSGYWLSFIRPNLVFDVLPKSLQQFRKVLSHFQSIYPRGSGIVFCMSKKECDSVTEMLNGALPFHMDLPDSVRNETQRRWENNEVKILCATPAFGKSVNKTNVRFIIHHTLPQSLEQYERQCALAGIDGQLSHCVLLYSFNDHLRVLRLIKEDVPKPPPNVLVMKENSLRTVLRYCENVDECRRTNLASCFGEKYSSEQCLATACPCTICEAVMDGKHQLKLYDFTGEALAVFSSIGMLKNVVLSYVADLFRGCLTKKRVKQTIDENRHGRLPLFGLGSGLTDFDCQRFMQKLVIDDYLNLRLVNTKHGTVIGYVNLARKGSTLLNKYKQQENVPPNERIYLHVSDAKEKRRSSKSHTDLDEDEAGISIVNKRKRLSSVY